MVDIYILALRLILTCKESQEKRPKQTASDVFWMAEMVKKTEILWIESS